VLLVALAATVALVVQDQTPLRAAAHESAPRQTVLTSGDWLEVRGEQQGFLQVYDHRRERPGYVRPSAVRSYALDEATAPKLASLVEYLRDAPGAESLGIGYVALYLRAAPAGAPLAEAFDALGTMAERLGDRASARGPQAGEASVAREIEVASSYGVHFVGFERQGATRLCYDGEAFRRVLALGGTGPSRVRAALGLTDPTCVDPAAGATASLALLQWQANVLGTVDPSALGPDVPPDARARLWLRRSAVDSALAYFAARGGEPALAKQAAEAARHDLQLVDRGVLADDDRPAYEEAALRAATVRWAAEAAPPQGAAGGGLEVELAAGSPGQTCVRLKARATPSAPVFEHCTYGVVWPSSVRVAARDAAVVMNVEPMEGWSELLVLHPAAAGWVAETLAPATVDPELGYVELAGFSPDGAHLLVAREWRASGPLGAPHTLAPWLTRTFQVVTATDLRVEKESRALGGLPPGKRWDGAEWRKGTLALR